MPNLRGLSLCIQGTHAPNGKPDGLKRFIPVYTGNSSRETSVDKNHPGLSLCIQGTLSEVKSDAQSARFIPVYTGNSGIKVVSDIF